MKDGTILGILSSSEFFNFFEEPKKRKIKYFIRVKHISEKSQRLDSGKFIDTTIYTKVKRVPKFKIKPLMKGMKYQLRKPIK